MPVGFEISECSVEIHRERDWRSRIGSRKRVGSFSVTLYGYGKFGLISRITYTRNYLVF